VFCALSGFVCDFISQRALFGAFLSLSFVPCGFVCDFFFLMSFCLVHIWACVLSLKWFCVIF